MSDTSSRGDRLAQLQQAGQNLVLGLFSLLRTAAIHDVNNRALDRPVAQMLETLDPFARRAGGRFSVVALEGQLYVDDIRVRITGQAYHIVEELEALLRTKGVGGVSFHGIPSPGELRRFAHTFQHHVGAIARDPFVSLQNALAEAGVGGLGLARPVRAQYEGDEVVGGTTTSRVATTITYAKAVSALSQLLADPSGRAQVRQRHMNRVVREIADCASETLEYLIGLTEVTANRYDRARLCVDTAVVAIALARSMELPRALIADLGAAAMAGCAGEGTVEKGPPPPAITALRELAGAARWTASLLRRTLIVAQRSQAVRGSGGQPDQYRLARLHRVARDYVALTHGIDPKSLDERDALTPLESLSFLTQCPPSLYDPLVIAHLVRVVGMYPIGTLLLLSDSRQAYVVGRASGGEPIALIRTGPKRFGDRDTLSNLGVEVAGVATDVDASERAAAVLGAEEQQAVLTVAQDVTKGSTLARVQIQRVAVRRKLDTD